MFDHLFYVVFCFLPTSRPVCRVGVHHFLYRMCAFCTRIASLCPGSGDLQHHATARRRQKYSGLRRIFASSSAHPCELPLEATICFEAALALAVLYLIPPHGRHHVHNHFVHNTFALHNCFGQKYFGCLVSYPTSGSPPAAT